MKRISPDIPTGCGLWQKLDKIMMWLNEQVQSTSKTILNYCDESDQVSFVTKTK